MIGELDSTHRSRLTAASYLPPHTDRDLDQDDRFLITMGMDQGVRLPVCRDAAR